MVEKWGRGGQDSWRGQDCQQDHISFHPFVQQDDTFSCCQGAGVEVRAFLSGTAPGSSGEKSNLRAQALIFVICNPAYFVELPTDAQHRVYYLITSL